MNPEKLGSAAVTALNLALSATIKPGIVDRNTDSAKKRPDYIDHVKAIGCMSPWFIRIAERSINSSGISPSTLLTVVRKMGMSAETDIEKTIGTIDGLKGSLFHMSICIAATGRLIASNVQPDPNRMGIIAQEMSFEIIEREMETLDVKINVLGEKSLTPGEQTYLKYKYKGARGSAESGYKVVRNHALPVIKKLSESYNISLNDIYVHTFLTLMAHVDDTGIAQKESDHAAIEIKDRATGILERGGVLTPLGREKIAKLDEHLNKRKLRPGGAGSLLPVAIFMSML